MYFFDNAILEVDMKTIVIVIQLLISLGDTSVSQAQDTLKPAIYRNPYNLSGPRIGVTYLSDEFVQSIEKKHDVKLNPWIAQIGWQWEKRFFTVRSGSTAVSEWVVLVGGFEQERLLPSLSWLLGMRNSKGVELGAGPNLSLSGTAFVLVTGITITSDEVNFPINFAAVLSKSGPRFSFLLGFNIKEE
jgi:hypothetical protein